MPWPTSSSTVKAMRARARGTSGCSISHLAAAMISATPALSSAPRSVVPSEVTMSWPTRSARSSLVAGESTWAAREHDLAAVVVPPDLRLDARRGRVRARVDVRDAGRRSGRRRGRPARASRRRSRARSARRRRARARGARRRGAARGRAAWPCSGRTPTRDRTACRCAHSERAGRARPRRARRQAAIRTGPPRPESLRAAPAQTRRAPT